MLVTSNWPFEQWTNFLPDAATAILDRLLHHCEAAVMSGDSYRLRQATAKISGNSEKRTRSDGPGGLQ